MAGIHYFYIYAKQRLKLNSGKINHNYLLNKIFVSHTSVMFNHGIYECITIWWLFELVRTSLLIVYLLGDLWDAIFICYLSVRSYNSSTPFQLSIHWFSKCRCLCHTACVEFTLVALVCSHCTCLIGVDVRRPDSHKDLYHRETYSCGMQFPAVWARLRDVASSWLGDVASAQRLLVHNWINNLFHFTQVFNTAISLSSNSHYL